MLKLRMFALTAGLVVAGTVLATAGSTSVSQKGKAFNPGDITVKAGEKVAFVNDDNVTHNVMSRTNGSKFNLGSQKPGEHAEHTFEDPGVVEVRCAIHPKMKMTVTVVE